MNINSPESNYLDLETAKKFQEKGISKWIKEKGVEARTFYVEWNQDDPERFERDLVIETDSYSGTSFGYYSGNEITADEIASADEIIPTFTLDQIISVLPGWVLVLFNPLRSHGGMVGKSKDYKAISNIIDKGYLERWNFLKIFSEILIYLWDKNLLENK